MSQARKFRRLSDEELRSHLMAPDRAEEQSKKACSLATVLFICKENSCRSQMAEAILNHLGPRWIRAISAGSRPTKEAKLLAWSEST